MLEAVLNIGLVVILLIVACLTGWHALDRLYGYDYGRWPKSSVTRYWRKKDRA